jgi:hypothetical protein
LSSWPSLVELRASARRSSPSSHRPLQRGQRSIGVRSSDGSMCSFMKPWPRGHMRLADWPTSVL